MIHAHDNYPKNSRALSEPKKKYVTRRKFLVPKRVRKKKYIHSDYQFGAIYLGRTLEK